jgi:hypothetical protein
MSFMHRDESGRFESKAELSEEYREYFKDYSSGDCPRGQEPDAETTEGWCESAVTVLQGRELGSAPC